MEPSGTIYSSVLLLGAAHGLFLAIALLSVRSGNRVALRLLGLLTITFAIDLAINYLNESGLIVSVPRLAFVESVAVFLYGPILYFYVGALASKTPWRLQSHDWLHLLPFVICVAVLMPFLPLSDETIIDMIYERADVGGEGWYWGLWKWYVNALPRLLIGLYLFLGFRRLAQHSRDIRDNFSFIEHISLNWLRNLLIAWVVLWVMYFVALAFGGRGPVENALNVAMVFVIYALGYMGLRQPAIFTQSDRSQSSAASSDAVIEDVAPAGKAKYERSSLDEASGKALLAELEAVMQDERPYLDSKLTLAQLADRLSISSNYLSQVINQHTGRNFFDFVNSYRIEAAQEILSDPAKRRMNVLTVAMDSGFNSKSAFYTAFKHHTNLTPSQFRQAKVS